MRCWATNAIRNHFDSSWSCLDLELRCHDRIYRFHLSRCKCLHSDNSQLQQHTPYADSSLATAAIFCHSKVGKTNIGDYGNGLSSKVYYMSFWSIGCWCSLAAWIRLLLPTPSESSQQQARVVLSRNLSKRPNPLPYSLYFAAHPSATFICHAHPEGEQLFLKSCPLFPQISSTNHAYPKSRRSHQT